MTSVFDHPWLSGLFADAELAALWSAEAQMAGMLRFEAAWCRALAKAGRVDAAEAETVAAQIEAFKPDMAGIADGMGTDGVPVPALVRQLKAATGADWLHKGATSQDVVDTAMVLTAVATLDVLDARLEKLIGALKTLSETHGEAAIMGRTRMQAALPIKASDRISSWTFPHFHHRERVAGLRARLSHLQIGGAAGDRAALGDDASVILKAMEQELGMPAGVKAWHAMRDGVAEFASVLSLVTGTLGKMGQDMCLMAQQGVDEIALSGGGGSSAMPHKQNPISAELLVTLARFNATQVAGMHQAMVHEQERSGSAWALEWMILPQMVMATGRSLNAGLDLIASIERIGSA